MTRWLIRLLRLPPSERSGTALRSPIYSLLPQDLRDPLPSDVIDPSLPTLWIAECLLVYLDPIISEGLVQWFEQHCKAWVGGIVYEMFGLGSVQSQLGLYGRRLS